MAADYRVQKAMAWRLQAEAFRLMAESDRIFFELYLCGSNGDSSKQLAEDYDRMARELEAEIAAGPMEVAA